ncbi:transglycosylase domain-containing protein [Nanoarchaeota archaeon]
MGKGRSYNNKNINRTRSSKKNKVKPKSPKKSNKPAKKFKKTAKPSKKIKPNIEQSLVQVKLENILNYQDIETLKQRYNQIPLFQSIDPIIIPPKPECLPLPKTDILEVPPDVPFEVINQINQDSKFMQYYDKGSNLGVAVGQNLRTATEFTYKNGKIATIWTSDKLWRGTKWSADKLWKGTKFTSKQTWEGLKYAGNGIKWSYNTSGDFLKRTGLDKPLKKTLKYSAIGTTTFVLGTAVLLKIEDETHFIEHAIAPVAIKFNHQRPESGSYWKYVHDHDDITEKLSGTLNIDYTKPPERKVKAGLTDLIIKSSINEVPKVPLNFETYTTTIYSRDNKILYRQAPNHVQLEDIPEYLKQTLVLLEDKNFYEHEGVNVSSIVRAGLVNVKDTVIDSVKDWDFHLVNSQGGSTITQQLAKNLFLKNEKKMTRKYQEAVLAVQLEKMYTKDEILELYFNNVNFGNGVNGINNASNFLFGKNVKDLSIGECALFAGMPKKPSYYVSNPDEAKGRRNFVLKQMLDNEIINMKQYNDAKSEEINFIKKNHNEYNHLLNYVKHEIKNKLNVDPDEFIQSSDLDIYTTFDFALQHSVEKQVKDYLGRLDKMKKLPDFNKVANEIIRNNPFNKQNELIQQLKQEKYVDFAGVILDYETGSILAMLDSGRGYDYYPRSWMAKYKFGSTVKPLIYLKAFELGILDLDSEMKDIPITYNIGDIQKVMVNGRLEDRICLDLPKQLKLFAPTDFKEPLGIVNTEIAFTKSLNLPVMRLVARGIGIHEDKDVSKVKQGFYAKVENCGDMKYFKQFDKKFYTANTTSEHMVADGMGNFEVIEMARRLGLDIEYKEAHHLGNVLGFSEGDTMMHLARATAAIANDGVLLEPHAIMFIKDKNNKILYQSSYNQKRVVFNKKALRNIQYLLEANVDHGTASALKKHFINQVKTKSITAGAKTGTTNDYEKALLTGYVNDDKHGNYTAFAFVVGHDTNKRMGWTTYYTGGSMVAPTVGAAYKGWFNNYQKPTHTVKKPDVNVDTSGYDEYFENKPTYKVPELKIVEKIKQMKDEPFIMKDDKENLFSFKNDSDNKTR